MITSQGKVLEAIFQVTSQYLREGFQVCSKKNTHYKCRCKTSDVFWIVFIWAVRMVFLPTGKIKLVPTFFLFVFIWNRFFLFFMWDFISYQPERLNAFPLSLNLCSPTAAKSPYIWFRPTGVSWLHLCYLILPPLLLSILVWGSSGFSFSSTFLLWRKDNGRTIDVPVEPVLISVFLLWAGWAGRPWWRLADREPAGHSEDSQYWS